VPLVAGALAHLECRVAARHVAGDHTLYVGEVLTMATRPGRPLLYFQGRYRRLDRDGGDPA
jgi:flavin reductase